MRTHLAIFLLGCLMLAACSSDHPCDDGGCVCEAASECAIGCEADDCAIDCGGAGDCDATCDDGCEYTCVDSSNCNVACDEDCLVTCDSVSNCDVDCGEDCDVACDSLSNCRVTMLSGIAHCTSVSNCDIQCVTSGGTEPATDCGDGLFACGSCP